MFAVDCDAIKGELARPITSPTHAFEIAATDYATQELSRRQAKQQNHDRDVCTIADVGTFAQNDPKENDAANALTPPITTAAARLPRKMAIPRRSVEQPHVGYDASCRAGRSIAILLQASLIWPNGLTSGECVLLHDRRSRTSTLHEGEVTARNDAREPLNNARFQRAGWRRR